MRTGSRRSPRVAVSRRSGSACWSGEQPSTTSASAIPHLRAFPPSSTNRWLKTVVVSDVEKAHVMRQVGIGKTVRSPGGSGAAVEGRNWWCQGAGSSVVVFDQSTGSVAFGRSRMDELKSSGKPFVISKWEVWEAYSQSGRAGCGRSDPRGVREGSAEEPVQPPDPPNLWTRFGGGRPDPCCGRAAAGNDAWRPRHRGDQTCRIRMVAWTRGRGPPFVEPETVSPRTPCA